MRFRIFLVWLLIAWAGNDSAIAQRVIVPGVGQEAVNPDPNAVRPIDGINTVFIEEMTWMEVRDAIRDGYTTVIIPTGGVEQNGPYIPTGKHNFVLRPMSQAIAQKLGRTLVAPVVPFVPEGRIDPPSGHMRYPGTISVSQGTFVALLKDIANSLRVHGFESIVLIGDSGGNQSGMQKAAKELNVDWNRLSARAYFIAEYYDNERVTRWLNEQGIHETEEGFHDNVQYTSQLMSINLDLVRFEQRRRADMANINGVSIEPPETMIELGGRIIEHQAEVTVRAIRNAISENESN